MHVRAALSAACVRAYSLGWHRHAVKTLSPQVRPMAEVATGLPAQLASNGLLTAELA